MPEQSLVELIRGLSPNALQIFKRQLSALPEADRQRAFSRLSGIPELSDIIGRPTPIREIEVAPKPQPTAQPKMADVPMWQKALSTVSAPFDWLSRNITQPFGAYVTSPFTPAIAGTEGMGWAERERAEYKAWDDPNWGFLGVKGIVETLPWLAVPSAAGVLGRAAGVGIKGAGLLGLAQKGGQLGRAAGVAAKVVKPIATVEAVPGKIIGGAIKKVLPKKPLIPEVGVAMPEATKQGILAMAGQGRPGLSTESMGLVYRSPAGKPIAVVTLNAEPSGAIRIGSVVTDEKSLLKGKATKAILDELKKTPNVTFPPVSEMSPEGLKMAEKFGAIPEEAGIPEVTAVLNEGNILILKEQRFQLPAGTRLQYLGRDKEGSPIFQPLIEGKAKMALPKGWSDTRVLEEIKGKAPFVPGAKVTLVKPPMPPPTAVGAEAIPPKPSEFDKFWELISGKKAVGRETARQAMMTKARAEQAARVTDRLNKIDPTKLTDAEYTRIWVEESKPLLKDLTKMGFPEEFKDEGVRRIRETLLAKNASEFEIKSTITAFKNAIEGGGVPRKLGVAGGSAYTRLARVFGKETTDILSSPSKLRKLAAPTGVDKEIVDYLRSIQEPLFKKVQKPLMPEAPWTPPAGIKGIPKEATEQLGIELATPPVPMVGAVVDYLRSLPVDEAGKKLMMLPEATRDKVWAAIKVKGEQVPDYLNILRASLSAGDVSGWGRQGAIAFARHPIAGLKAARQSLKALFDPKHAADVDRMIKTDPDIVEFIARSQKVNREFYIAPPIERITGLGIKEEAYMSNVATRIPVLGAIIRASGRNFITFLNLMRYHMAKDFMKGWVEPARRIGREVTDLDFGEMSRLINVSTGRGDLKLLGMDFNRAGGFLNTVLFSPRLFFSRFQWPAMIGSPSKVVRVEAWKQIGSFLAAGGSAMSALKLAGGDIELDPRSADFGKVQIGDIRLDVWTGYTQYIKMFAQLTTAERKTEGGFIQQVDRKEVAGRFLQSKLSPAVGLFNDLLEGRTFIGEEFPAKTPAGLLEQVYQRAAPMAIQDMIDGFIQGGVEGGIIASTSLFGVGVVTYMDEVKRVRDKVARQKYGMTWEEIGQRYGRAEQLKLEQTTPSLIAAEKKQEEKFATGTPTTMGRWWNEGQAVEDAYRDLINKAAAEVKQTNDWVTFRKKVDRASQYRRESYNTRQQRKEYQEIVAYYNEPLKPEQIAKMNPGDVLRREYDKMMFASNMYDDFGNYLFDKAEEKERAFVAEHGQQALDYIEEYRGARWVDKPPELKMLEDARELLKPYWEIRDKVWSMYPVGLQAISDQIQIMENTDPLRAKQMLRKYPMILRARELIARYKKQMRDYNPAIRQAYRFFYG